MFTTSSLDWSQAAALAVGLLLAVCGRASAGESDACAKLRGVLCRDAWSHASRVGPTVAEQRVFAFYEDGTVRLSVLDDTGRHPAQGTWSLAESDGQMTLTLEGELMGSQAVYSVRYDATHEVIAIADRRGGPAVEYEHVKGYRPPQE
jgi:hypothetical protein